MHQQLLTDPQRSALAVLGNQPALRSFYLAGGTGLALHLGHRESVDFDFFRLESFDPQWLLAELPTPPPVKILQEAANTLTVEFRRVKVSWFGYPQPLLQPLAHDDLPFGVASVADIAAMKLAAIAGRGSRKDFVDLYVICRNCFPLREAFHYLQAKFTQQEYDLYHILRSLTYFADAEAEPMPRLRQAIDWNTLCGFFRTEAARLRLG